MGNRTMVCEIFIYRGKRKMKFKLFLKKYCIALSSFVCFCVSYYFVSTDINVQKIWQSNNEGLKLIKLAEEGDVDAQFDLSYAYYNGEGVVQNAKESLFWMLKVAEQGDPKAQFITGLIYAGIEHDYKEAVKWYTIAELNNYNFKADGTNAKLVMIKLAKGHLSSEEIRGAREMAIEWGEGHEEKI